MRRFKGNLLSVGKPLRFETSSSKTHILKLSTQGVSSAIPISVPYAPTDVSANEPGNSQARVTWKAPEKNGGSVVTSYILTCSEGFTQVVSGTLTTTIFTGLTNGTTYTFTVQAINIAGASIASNPSNSVTTIQPLAEVTLVTPSLDTTFPDNRFGSTLEISSDGNVICVTNCNSTNVRYIKIYRFNASNANWNNEKTITTSYVDTGDPFEEPAAPFWGNAVAVSGNGNYIGIGNSSSSIFFYNGGLVEVYEYNVTTQLWSRNSWVNSILAQNYNGTGSFPTAANNGWGINLSFNYNGNVFAVGSAQFGYNGTIKIYKQNNNVWTLTSTIPGVDLQRLGHRISLSSSGTRLIAGVIDSKVKTYVESPTNTWSIFSSPSPALITLTNTLNSSGSLVKMSKDGTTFIASDTRYAGPLGNLQGLVKIYRFISNSWTKIGQDLIGPFASSEYGSSLAISNTGNIIAICARGTYSGKGSVYCYKYNSSTDYWDFLFTQDGLSTSDRIGTFMTFGMTSDATKLVFGVPNTGNGSVRIYNVVYDSSIIP